ncbi:hypothetical protein [Chondromyces crocatus]|uniref:hypothetical protein n=1 Tax=Chondromyces crocatus TaxID=52 RepID=UPI0012E2341E|nr:hypothetical protein [Chondromyces crocatus]
MYLFLSRSEKDEGTFADEWYEYVSDAEAEAEERFGITKDMWIEVPEPQAGCQPDWIEPVRVRGRKYGEPEYGVLERLVNGEWVVIPQKRPK